MYDIQQDTASEEFIEMWLAAINHINDCMGKSDRKFSWLKPNMDQPFLEHFSFRLENQVVFVRVLDESKCVHSPGSLDGLRAIATGWNGHAICLPMRNSINGWVPDRNGWGLIDSETSQPFNPESVVTDELIEMTEWELHDFAVQIVRDQIEKEGMQILSTQGNPSVDPSIWFLRDQKQPEWVVVRAVRYPDSEAEIPSNIDDIRLMCSRNSPVGNFASVAIANSEDTFDDNLPLKLFRGKGMYVSYQGMIPIE